MASDPARSRAVQALLGALLIDPAAMDEVASIVAPDDFPTERARAVYAAMRDLHARGIPTDFVTVADELERRGDLEKIGTSALTELVNRCPTSLHAAHYARLVADRARAQTAARPKTAIPL